MSNDTFVTRFPNGVTNIGPNKPLSSFPAPDPTKCHVIFDDFNTYNTANWTVTETQAGATQALTTGNGGLILLTNTAADDDKNIIGNVSTPIVLDSTKNHWFKGRLKVSTDTQVDVFMGLNDTVDIPGADYIQFTKDDGATSFYFKSTPDSGTTSVSATSLSTLVADTFVTLGWYYDSKDKRIYIYVNDVLKSVISSGVVAALPNAAVRVVAGIRNGDANARTATFDYVFFAQER